MYDRRNINGVEWSIRGRSCFNTSQQLSDCRVCGQELSHLRLIAVSHRPKPLGHFLGLKDRLQAPPSHFVWLFSSNPPKDFSHSLFFSLLTSLCTKPSMFMALSRSLDGPFLIINCINRVFAHSVITVEYNAFGHDKVLWHAACPDFNSATTTHESLKSLRCTERMLHRGPSVENSVMCSASSVRSSFWCCCRSSPQYKNKFGLSR